MAVHPAGSDQRTGFRVASRIDEGQIMLKSRRIPTWLARRSYFKRIERWAKIGKARKMAPEATSVPMPSNVVLFPMRMNRPERPAFEDLREVGTA
ncbi:hypothetical protein [Methylobacterium sp. PvR107]|uniref:hypothetical protein n=1 Tax=Methylobacterium sp. PvR107 TaxID=2806597 RepID=UPI001B65AD68|nr:hypothetical protein [Methylobacterium sp. PvR107]MBP1178802.1 hypothetical protein [Methylobacterium sp. PvR107]